MQNISLMQRYFFGHLLGFLYNLADFQSNIEEIKEKVLSRAAACDGNFYTISYSCHQDLPGTLPLN